MKYFGHVACTLVREFAIGEAKINERTFFSILLVLTLLILTSTAASACDMIKIGRGTEPAVDGNKIAWTDGGTVHIYDLTTKNNTGISTSAASYQAIPGDKLVWLDKSTGMPKLAVYDKRPKPGPILQQI